MDGYENFILLRDRLEAEGSTNALLEFEALRSNSLEEERKQGMSRTLYGRQSRTV